MEIATGHKIPLFIGRNIEKNIIDREFFSKTFVNCHFFVVNNICQIGKNP